MSRFLVRRLSHSSIARFTLAATALAAGAAHGATSASIVPGSLTPGSTTLSGPYLSETNSLRDWVLDTGAFAGSVFPLSPTNANFNGNAFGGTPNTLIAFGNGGGVTLRLDAGVRPLPGAKELGLFTAQFYSAASGLAFNDYMEAAILVSADNINFFTLAGAPVPSNFTGGSSPLNAPTVAYDYETGARAAEYGNGTDPANLAALSIANFETPMPDDALFNGPGTPAERAALLGSAGPAAYDAVFGASGGGNWIDLSGSGLVEINFIRLNGVSTPGAGVRLDAVFVNPAAVVPEAGAVALLVPAASVLRRRR